MSIYRLDDDGFVKIYKSLFRWFKDKYVDIETYNTLADRVSELETTIANLSPGSGGSCEICENLEIATDPEVEKLIAEKFGFTIEEPEPEAAVKWIGYYGANRAVLKVPEYDLLILESDNIGPLTEEQKNGKKCLAYIAIAEVVSGRWFYPLCKDKDFIAETNNDWGSYRINTASEEWQDILLNTVAPVILDERNYDGIFFDTCDVAEYLEGTYPDQYPGAVEGTKDIIEKFKEKWPDKLIACNSGYKPIKDAASSIDYYVIESTISTWKLTGDEVTYVPASDSRKDYWYPKMDEIKNLGIEILDWEYGNVTDIDEMKSIKAIGIEHGWNPFVTNRNIDWFPEMDTLTPEYVTVIPPTVPDPDDDPENWIPAEDKISFIAATDGENVNFFSNGKIFPIVDKFKVSINDEETEQQYTDLTFSAGDKIDIQLLDDKSYYPPFFPGHWNKTLAKDYVEEILEPFPAFYVSSGNPYISPSNMFTYCSNLKKVPEGLFKNNTFIITAYYMFAQSGIEAIPEKLFENCDKITTFEACFSTCLSLSSVANDLFAYSPVATNMRYVFSGSFVTEFALNIVSPLVDICKTFVSDTTGATPAIRYVIVPDDSTTCQTFIDAKCNRLGVITASGDNVGPTWLYRVQPTSSILTIRSEPSTSASNIGTANKDTIYNIMDEVVADGHTWGKLEQGGWIALTYTTRV